ncbi:PREDICTED: uncharacterized protein LOC109150603 [Ipomoea nil]|uniref:uncharacterized protein LOC109150603 n=1 Tax=Ipomoea nil TaxID=35883 RepID=UPI000900BA5E|nr:PREDICTED: uncharacterized protein LOC109150603 [Ipomoea nil]
MTEAQPTENGGGMAAASEQIGTKRQRRPSVRLGDIGGNHTSYEHRRDRVKAPWKDSSSKAASKTRHLTNFSSNETLTLADNNANDNTGRNANKKISNNVDEDDDRGDNLDSVAIGSWKVRDLKSKRGATTKRVRSNWFSSSKANESDGDDKVISGSREEVENNDEICPDSETEDSEHTPLHPLDNNKNNTNAGMGDDARGIGNLTSRRMTRVSEEGPSDTEFRNWNYSSERNGVKVWLNQLGLGRYAPLFEIHEVDDEVLPMLTLEDLKDMGIKAVGSRRKMYCAIQKLNKGFS